MKDTREIKGEEKRERERERRREKEGEESTKESRQYVYRGERKKQGEKERRRERKKETDEKREEERPWGSSEGERNEMKAVDAPVCTSWTVTTPEDEKQNSRLLAIR